MESIYLLIPLVLVFTAVAVWIYIWAVNNGQYDDLDKEAEQLLFDEDVGAVHEPPLHELSVHESSVGAGFKPARVDLKSAPTNSNKHD